MRPKRSAGPSIGLLLGAAFCVVTGRAEAQEYCVACTGPPAVYRCVIDGAKPGGSQPLQVLCVSVMAKEGRHAACNVKGGTVFDCNGPVKRVPWAAYNAAALPLTKQEPPPAQPAKEPSQPPQTMEEMAKRTNEKGAEQLKTASDTVKEQAKSFGENVGDATKKTWRCVASLFTQCKE